MIYLIYLPMFAGLWLVYKATKKLRLDSVSLMSFKHLSPKTTYVTGKIEDLETSILFSRINITCGLFIAVGSLVMLVIYF